MNASLLVSFDLPGCGRSEGSLCLDMSQQLNDVVSFALRHGGCSSVADTELVIWGRGMGTSLAMEFAAAAAAGGASTAAVPRLSLRDQQGDGEGVQGNREGGVARLKLLVLDTCFVSIEDMVKEGASKVTQPDG